MLDLDYKLKEFKNELAYLKTDIIKKMAEVCIGNFPDYFWYKPASSSGKYHPVADLGVGGLVRHTKNNICVLNCWLNHPHLQEKYTQLERDCAILALLIHDAVKYGAEDGEHTVYEHPMLVREHLNPTDSFEGDDIERVSLIWGVVCDLAESHMGVWNKNREGEEVCSLPESELQWLVHFADFTASQRYIDVQPFNSYSSTSTSVAKPSEAQLNYIASLEKKLVSKGVQFDKVVPTTSSQASTYIKKLKGM